jgi:hypothetical protein
MQDTRRLLFIPLTLLSAVTLAAQNPTTINLAATTSPTAAQPGVTVVTLTASGFPTGSITASGVNVTLQAATGSTGPALTANVTGFSSLPGAGGRITFQVAGSNVTTPTPYLVSVSGKTSTGNSFASGKPSALTINPGASIISLAPNNGVIGKSVTVAITGQYTNYVQGSTKANFGAGISVGGAAEGAAGPVTVTSPTTATAQITIDPAAATGMQTVTIATGAQQATLTNGFTVNGPPGINSLNPSSALQGQANVPVVISGLYTHFAAGTTQVSFGAGITVASVIVANTTTLTANINVASNAATGPYTVTVTTGGETASLANGFTVQAGPPVITLTAPTNLSFLNISPTTVNGTVSDPTATVVINSIPAPVANGAFSIQLPLAEGPNLIVATATSGATGLVSTTSIQVTLDTTPPHVTITSPANQFVTTASSISVAGSVNDIVVGTVNAQQAQVTVNGTAAQVANRSFLASNIPLNLGTNSIQAVAVDQAGNEATTQITVTRQAPAAQPQIQLISGNNQTGVIGTVLPAPLIVGLTDANGNPVANQYVIFKVIQDNGMVAAAAGTPASSVVATTNAQGQAQVQWTLGQRAGAGSDSLEAYAVGFNGTAVFTATSNLGVAGKIVIDSGNNQIGAIGQSLPLPLIGVVVDSGNNRLPNVPVTFTVQHGGGGLIGTAGTNFTLGQNTFGMPTLTVSTDSNGRAGASLILGYQEGNANNIVTADFSGDQGVPAVFAASGRAAGAAASTTITGVVLDNTSVPIPGVTIRAVLTNLLNSNSGSINAAATVQTNAQGQFAITQAPVGFVKLLVDGSTATVQGNYPTLDYDMVTIAGQNNTLGQPIYLLPLNPANQLCVTATTGGGTLTIPEAPGFSLTFGPGQVTFPGGSQTGCVSVTVVHPDRVPMQPGFGQQPRFIVTIQPSGALFNPPAPITLPNVDGLQPREVTEMYSFDHDIGSFVAIGTGTVSDDGQVIRSSQGVGVLKAGWHCGGDPTSTGAAADCPVCFFCAGSLAICQPQGNGTACGNGGTCQFQQGCVCPPGQVFNPSTGSCVNNAPCPPGFTLNNGQCCQGATCNPPCSPGLTFNATTGTCVNKGPCPSGYTLNGTQCCPPTGTCFQPTCPPGEVFDPATGTCVNGCGNCSSNNPCIDASCGTNNQCVFTPNQLCQSPCNGATSGSCSVGGITGMCDASGNCNLCGSLGTGSSCTCGNGATGTCNSSGQCGGCPSIAFQLSQIGPTVISSDGLYSEDTTIQVTAVDGTTGQVLTGFNGTVTIAEDGTAIYSQNGGTLPASVTISFDGTGTFVAKSLAGPKLPIGPSGGSKPDPAIITVTNYPIYGPELSIEQWISNSQIDPRSSGEVFDWVQARAKDIFAAATGDLLAVLSRASSYSTAPLSGEYGETPVSHSSTSQIMINPYFNEMRVNTSGGTVCNNTRSQIFTNTFIHESRHAYQLYLSTLTNNDKDQDYLVNNVLIAPLDVIVDSTSGRTVCNTNTNTTETRSYKGDSVPDSLDSPDFSSYAFEEDAYTFAEN